MEKKMSDNVRNAKTNVKRGYQLYREACFRNGDEPLSFSDWKEQMISRRMPMAVSLKKTDD